MWPGLAAYRVSDGTSSAFTIQEIPDQIRTTRARGGTSGNFLYNTTATLKRNGGALATALAQDLYRNASLVPAVPWLDSALPPTPSITLSGTMLTMTPAAGESVRWWAVRLHSPGAWTFRVLFGTERSLAVATAVDRILVQAADQAGNLGPSAEWRR